MGRKKQAPQPLSLPDSNNPNSTSTSTSISTSTSNPPSASRSATVTATSADLETVSSASTALSPADSRSPGSQTATARSSPFSSRFSQKRPQTARAGNQPRTADFESFDKQRPSQPYSDPQTQKPVHIASAYNPSSAPPQTANPENRKTSKGGFFHFAKSSKSTNQFSSHAHQSSVSSRGETQPSQSRASSRGPSSAKQGALTDSTTQPELPRDNSKSLHLKTSRSELSLSQAAKRQDSGGSAGEKKPKSKPFGLLKRTKSLRDKDINIANSSSHNTHDPMPALVSQPQSQPKMDARDSPPLRTAPITNDRSFRETMDSSVRNKSEDRAAPTREGATSREQHRDTSHKEPRTMPQSNGGSTFFSGLKNSGTKAAGMFGSRFFGKGHRSASTHEREHAIEDEHYELKVLTLPLAQQARKTRISKRLEDSRDKTEFWMPAFPWRAIDYLNYKGCEVEGLYRVPGSGPQIKKWQRRFDEEGDVNLFEAEDLYDINIIGSMLKAWLRELPDELFPKAAQERIARECAGAETVPQMLIDELSNLSPFQYYLLFAITCHLSLLLAHSDKNKMDFRNLCICFQPCMKIDAFSFKFLVCDWRDCWKGCVNETAYIEQEYILMDKPPPQGLASAQEPARSESPSKASNKSETRHRSPSVDNRSKHSNNSGAGASEAEQATTSKQVETPKKGNIKESESKGSMGSDDTISTTLTINSDPEPSKGNGDLRRLSPIKPLSPLGFQ